MLDHEAYLFLRGIARAHNRFLDLPGRVLRNGQVAQRGRQENGPPRMSEGQRATHVLALEDVLDYVQEREQFGKSLVEFQAVQMKLAE